MLDIRINIKKDLDLYAIKLAMDLNYNINSASNLCPMMQLLNICLREITPKPRNIIESKTFTCPAKLKDGYDLLKAKITSGQNINQHLSSNLKDADYHDGFLNDFGLYHLHLGVQNIQAGKSQGFIERTGPVAIAYVTDTTIYMLGIRTHGRGHSDLWFDTNLIEIIHQNWPVVIDKFKVNGSLASPSPTINERKQLRKISCNTMVTMSDGTIYMPLGGGVTSANSNVNISLRYIALCKRIERQTKAIVNHISNKEIKTYPITLRVINFDHDNLFLFDENNYQLYELKNQGNKQIITHYNFGNIPPNYIDESELPINESAGFLLKYLNVKPGVLS